MRVDKILLTISLGLMLIGLGFIIYEKTRPGMTIETALSELGETGGIIYFKPGYWTFSDKCVSKVVKKRDKHNTTRILGVRFMEG